MVRGGVPCHRLIGLSGEDQEPGGAVADQLLVALAHGGRLHATVTWPFIKITRPNLPLLVLRGQAYRSLTL